MEVYIENSKDTYCESQTKTNGIPKGGGKQGARALGATLGRVLKSI